MPVTISPTPNPNALKFTVGTDVGGPKTFSAGQEVDDPVAADIIAIEGVASVFMTADFVTLTKQPDADWGSITGSAQAVLESHYGG